MLEDRGEGEREEAAYRKARHAYERGRIVHAVSLAAYCVPLGVACTAVCGSPVAARAAVLVALLLFAAVAVLLWRGRELSRAVIPGLIAGAVGFSVLLLFQASGVGCGGERCALICGTAALVSGFVALRLAIFVTQRHCAGRRGPAVGVFVIGALTAVLGLMPAGGAATAGFAVGTAAVALSIRLSRR